MEPEYQDDEDSSQPKKTTSRGPGPGLLIPLALIAVLAGIFFLRTAGPERTEIPYSLFIEQLRAKNVAEVELGSSLAVGRFKKPPLLPADPPPAKAEGKPPAEGKAAEKKAAPKRSREHFIVKLSAGIQESDRFQQLLEESGARFDNQLQYDATPWAQNESGWAERYE